MLRARTLITLLTLTWALAGCGGTQQVARSPETEALFTAVRGGHADTVKSLLAAGRANVNGKDERGNTPLSEAARLGHNEVVQALLVARADVNAKDGDGRTALALAAQGGHDEIVRLLRQAGAKE